MFKFFESIGRFIRVLVDLFVSVVKGLLGLIQLMVSLFDWVVSDSFSVLLPEFAVSAVLVIISVSVYKFLSKRGD